jgi:xylulokinase
VVAPGEAAGELTAAAAEVLGLEPGIPVAAGTGDNMAAALGLALAPGDVAISIGTSGTVFTVSERPVHDPSGAVAGFADATGRHLPLVCTLNATQVTDLVARWLGTDQPGLVELALAAPAGAGGVTLLPYLAGERTPNRPDATGVLGGLRLDTDVAHLARAAHEGVVCGLLDGVDALAAAGLDVDGGRIVVVGGGSRSPAYTRVLADLGGRTITVAAPGEHVATGACVQAAAVATGSEPLAVAAAWDPAHGTEIEPDATADGAGVRARYASLRDGA